MNEHAQKPDLVLLDQYQNEGNAAAGEELFSRYLKNMFGFFLNNKVNRDDAMDLVQECVIDIITCRSFRLCLIQNFRCFVFTVCANRRNQFFRKRKAARIISIQGDEALNRAVEMEPSGPGPALPEYCIELEQLMEQVKQVLSPTEFAVLDLTHQGYKNDEIARQLGLSESNVSTIKSRAQGKCRNSKFS